MHHDIYYISYVTCHDICYISRDIILLAHATYYIIIYHDIYLIYLLQCLSLTCVFAQRVSSNIATLSRTQIVVVQSLTELATLSKTLIVLKVYL